MPRLILNVDPGTAAMCEAECCTASARLQLPPSAVVHRAATPENVSKRIPQHRGIDPDDSKPLLICLRPGTSLIHYRVDEVN